MGRLRGPAGGRPRGRHRADPHAREPALTSSPGVRRHPRALKGLTAVVLVGGKGTRLGSTTSTMPKPLLAVGGRPFLWWPTKWLAGQGVTDLVFAAGHLGEQVEAWVSTLRLPAPYRVSVRREAGSMGTGGAVLGCLDLCQELVLVANGDTLLLADLPRAVDRLRTEELEALVIAVPVPDASRFGTVDANRDGRLVGFREKATGAGLVNGGLTLFRRAVLEELLPARPMSLERDIMPSLLSDRRRIGVTVADAPFLDIGTPEALASAGAFVADHLGMQAHQSIGRVARRE